MNYDKSCVVIAVERSSSMKQHLPSLIESYLTPAMKFFLEGLDEENDVFFRQSSPAEFSVVFFGADSFMNGSAYQLKTFGPTPSMKETLNCLKSADYECPNSSRLSSITEGLQGVYNAMTMMDTTASRKALAATKNATNPSTGSANTTENSSQNKKFCILITQSNPFVNPWSSPSYDQIVTNFKSSGIKLSILCPHKQPELLKLFELCGGDLNSTTQKNYATKSHHLVALSGFTLAEQDNSHIEQSNPSTTTTNTTSAASTNLQQPNSNASQPSPVQQQLPFTANSPASIQQMNQQQNIQMNQQQQNMQQMNQQQQLSQQQNMQQLNQQNMQMNQQQQQQQNIQQMNQQQPQQQQNMQMNQQQNMQMNQQQNLQNTQQQQQIRPMNPVGGGGVPQNANMVRGQCMMRGVNPMVGNRPQWPGVMNQQDQQNQMQNKPNQTVGNQHGGNDASNSGQQNISTSGNPGHGTQHQVVWQGMLEIHEKKEAGAMARTVSHQIPCKMKSNAVNGEPEVNTTHWPSVLLVKFIPKNLLSCLGPYFKNMHTVLFHPEQCPALSVLNNNFANGMAGCVQPASNINNLSVRVIILLFSPEKNTYVGFIPYDQASFLTKMNQVLVNNRRPGTGVPMQRMPNPGMTGGNPVGNVNMTGGGIINSNQMGVPQSGGMQAQQQPGGMMSGGHGAASGMSGGSVLANQLIRPQSNNMNPAMQQSGQPVSQEPQYQMSGAMPPNMQMAGGMMGGQQVGRPGGVMQQNMGQQGNPRVMALLQQQQQQQQQQQMMMMQQHQNMRPSNMGVQGNMMSNNMGVQGNLGGPQGNLGGPQGNLGSNQGAMGQGGMGQVAMGGQNAPMGGNLPAEGQDFMDMILN